MITDKQVVHAQTAPDLIAYIIASEIEHDPVPLSGYYRSETADSVLARVHYLFSQEH